MPKQNTESAETKSRSALLNDSYGAAMKRLRDNHLEEFNTLRVEEAKARGIEWVPPKTEAQKAREQVQALLTAHPELASEFLTTQA